MTWRHEQVAVLIDAGALAVNDGYRVTNRELGEHGTPFVRGGDIGHAGEIDTNVVDHVLPEYFDRLGAKLSRPGDVAFITKGNVGRVGFLREGQPQVVFAPQICYWRSLDQSVFEPRFLFYLLSSRAFQANLEAVKTHGSMVADYVSLSDQRSFRLPVPPITDQRAIAQVLGALDDKIEMNRRTNETLEAMARALFKSWFVDFDPVHAKKAGRVPERMDAEIAALFPDDFAPELHLPSGWDERCLYDCAEWINGAAYRDFAFSAFGEGLPIVKIAELKAGVTSQTRFTLGNPGGKYRIDTGDVLFSWSGNPDTSIDTFVWLLGPAWLNQHIFKVIPRSTQQRTYVLCLLRHLRPVFAEIARDKQTTGLGHVTAGDMKRLLVANPPEVVIDAFHAKVGPILKRIESRSLESIRLTEMRDALLPKLVSGELRIPEAERIVGKAV